MQKENTGKAGEIMDCETNQNQKIEKKDGKPICNQSKSFKITSNRKLYRIKELTNKQWSPESDHGTILFVYCLVLDGCQSPKMRLLLFGERPQSKNGTSHNN